MKKLIDAIKKALGMDKKSSDSSQGFTLIELLVVIAVIGVLAAGILLAIDPLEQIRRAQDSSKKEQLVGVGRAIEAYYINSAAGTSAAYPSGATWLSVGLAGEFKTVPDGNTIAAAQCTGGTVENNFCLKTNGTPAFVVYTTLVNKADRGRAATAAGSGCTNQASTFYVYSSALGKAGIVCTQPGAGYNGTLY